MCSGNLAFQKNTKNPTTLATTFNINGYTSYYCSEGNTTRGGLAFFILNNISHTLMPPVTGNTNLEASGIAIHGRGGDLNIINCYIHPGAGQNTLTIEDFNKLIAKGNKETIIVGDFNSKNVVWGSAYTCNQGRVIEDFMENNKLLCLNDGSATYIFNSHNTPSWLDITLVPDHMVANCVWEVLNQLGSDHFPILTQYMVEKYFKS